MKIKQKYTAAKEAALGTECTCPSCGTKFIKTNPQQAFCKSKGGTICKDKYWNTVTPTKRNNTTRISPASAAYMARMARPDRVTHYTSEGYKVIGGIAYNEFDNPVYDVDPCDDTHPFDVGDAGDHGKL
jgi:hypothetical protein